METNNFEQRISAIEQSIKEIKKEISLLKENPESITHEKKTSIKEFLITKKIDDDVKRTLAIAYFIEKKEKNVPFNADDLKKGFRTAKIPSPININDKINLNIKNGHIMEAEEKKESKKAWELTATGEAFVENELNKQSP